MPDLRAVVLLDSSKGEMVLEAFRSGARGVFSKNDSVDILSKCLRKVYEGQIWANTQQIATLVQALASSHNIQAVDARGLNLLSKREMEVVRSVAQGLSNREIAERLHLSQHTIKNSLFRIFDKLGVSNRVELLFMTLSQERHAQSVFQHFLNEEAYESLQDEATLIATQNAADQGVVMAQLALAQFYSAHRTNLANALNSYMWYSIASEQISQGYKEATKGLTMDQLLQAEQMAAERPRKRKTIFAVDKRPGPAKTGRTATEALRVRRHYDVVDCSWLAKLWRLERHMATKHESPARSRYSRGEPPSGTNSKNSCSWLHPACPQPPGVSISRSE